MLRHGAPISRWGVHVCAGLLGLAAYGAITAVRWRSARVVAPWLALVGLLAIGSTLLAPGIDGMQRWHELGPLRIHPSALLLPALLVFAAGWLARHWLATHALLLTVQLVHFAQPDAGQATALGFGAVTLALVDSRPRWRLLLVAVYLLSIVGTWLRFDPLPPAPFVEDIVPQAFALAPVVGVVGLVSLALFVFSPVLGAGSGRGLPASLALVGYFAGSIVATGLGEYPVPLLGFGTSPTVGAFLGLAALRRLQVAVGGSRGVAVPARQAPANDERPRSKSALKLALFRARAAA
jgi:hypothetical protein